MLLRITLFVLFLLFSNSVLAGDWCILHGERVDYLFNTKTGEIRTGDGVCFKGDNEDSAREGYFFVYKNYAVSLNALGKELSEDHRPSRDNILPEPHGVQSLQWLISDNRLVLPSVSGWMLIDPGTDKYHMIPYDWQVEMPGPKEMNIHIPQILVVGDKFWLLSQKKLMVWTGVSWVTCYDIPGKGVLNSILIGGTRFVNLLMLMVDPGDLGSFRTQVVSFDSTDHKQVGNRTFEGILKNPSADASGRVVFEYIKPSLLSMLLDRKKLRLRILDPGNNQSYTRLFHLTDKRRHISEIQTRDGSILLAVQCKDGNTFVVDPFGDHVWQLQGKYGYDYTLIRGTEHGTFFNENTGLWTVVSFDRVPNQS